MATQMRRVTGSKILAILLTLTMVLGSLLPCLLVTASASAPSYYTDIEADTSVSVTLTSSNSTQYFRFVPTYNGTYRFYSSNNSGDPKATLLNADGNGIITSDDDLSGNNFCIEQQLVAGATYYLQAYMWGGGYGSYTLNLETVEVDMSSALPELVADSEIYVEIEEEFAPYRFVPETSGLYRFYSINSTGDAAILLLDENGNEVASDDNSGADGNFYLEQVLRADETYYVLAALVDAPTGSYTMLVEQIALDTITVGGEWYVEIPSSGNFKFFAFSPSADGCYRFYSTNNSGDTYAYLYDANFDELTTNDDGAVDRNFAITYDLYAGETYYFAAGMLGHGEGTFTVLLEAVEYYYEQIYTDTSADVVIPASGDFKYFKFIPERSGNYNFYSTNNSGDTYAYLYDANFNELTSNDDGGSNRNFLINADLYAGETYYFSAGMLGHGAGSFTVVLETVSLAMNYETIRPGANAYVEIPSSGEYKLFAFTPEASGTYRFYSYNNSGDTYVILYDADMNELRTNDDGGNGVNFSISYDFVAGETYYYSAGMLSRGSGNFYVALETVSTTPDIPTGGVVVTGGNRTYPLFNSGVTTSQGRVYSSASGADYNPNSHSYNNNGYDIYGDSGQNRPLTVGMGLSFYIQDAVTERATLTVYAYDIDEERNQIDYVYLVDETTNTRTRIGNLTGMDSSWTTTRLYIDPSMFTVGHTYHFENDICQGGWWTWIRTVSIEMTTDGNSNPDITVPTITSHSFSASIDSNGLVSIVLDLWATEDIAYSYELAALINSTQRGGIENQLITATPGGVHTTNSFYLESGAPKGSYQIVVVIKDAQGNTAATYSTTAGYDFLAVTYDSNGGSNNLPTDTNAYSSGDWVSVLFDYIPSRSGYVFLGWSVDPNATVPEFTENGTREFTISGGDVCLYAIWEEEEIDTPDLPDVPVVPGVVDLWDGTVAGGFGGGNGTDYDPYLINSAAQLAYLAASVNAGNSYEGMYFRLTTDIDLNDIEWIPIGHGVATYDYTASQTDAQFRGHFDGNFHRILNLYITENRTTYTGLFGDVAGTISNLGIEDAHVYAEQTANIRSKVGALVGRICNGSVNNCYVLFCEVGTTTPSHPSSAGGLIGNMLQSTVTDCFAMGMAISNGHVGGLVGSVYSANCLISNSYAIGYVEHIQPYASSCTVCAAGILGYGNSGSNVVNCFFGGEISTSNSNTGTMIGTNAGYSNVSNCYYYLENCSVSNHQGSQTDLENLLNEEWIKNNLFWDFNNSWLISEDYGIPFLKGFGNASSVHTHNAVWEYTVEPTCTLGGYGRQYCTTCEEVLYEGPVSALGHDFVLVEETEPDCTTDGYTLYECHCGATKEQILYAAGHDFGDDHICDHCGYERVVHTHVYNPTVVDPTCTSVGYTVYTCDCGDSYRADYVDQLGHHWDEGVVTQEKTCDTDGQKTYTCVDCGTTYDVVIRAGHNWSEEVTVEATCTTDGSLTRTCQLCQLVEVETIPAAHSWDDGEVTLEPTCNDAGIKLCTCTVCSETAEIEIPKLGHHFVDGSCSICGATIPDVVTPNGNHPEYGMYFEIDDIISNYGPDFINEYGVLLDYNEDANIKKVAVFLTQDGNMWRRCIACVGDNITYATYVPYLSYDEDIKYTGLNSAWINTFRLQENRDGIWCYSNYATIGVNLADAQGNLLLSLYDIGQAGAQTRIFDDLDEMIAWLLEDSDCIEHEEGDWIVDTEATCSEEGYRHTECVNCGRLMNEETIPATGEHVASDWIVDVDATCSQEGSCHTECVYCYVLMDEDVIPATGNHWYSDWIVDVEATCVTDGHAYRECVDCHTLLEEQTLFCRGYHRESEWIVDLEPTATATGHRYTYCYDCYETLNEETMPVLAFIKVEDVETRAGATVTVTIDVQNNPGILGAVLTLEYDYRLTLIDAQAGGAWSSLNLTLPAHYSNPCNFVWDGMMGADYSNGTILTLTFRIPEYAEDGDEFWVSLSYMRGNMVNDNLENIDLAIEAGVITVTELIGDVNDDGVVDVADVITLRRYMAGGYDVTVNENNADLNGDGMITVVDIIALRRYIVNGTI